MRKDINLATDDVEYDRGDDNVSLSISTEFVNEAVNRHVQRLVDQMEDVTKGNETLGSKKSKTAASAEAYYEPFPGTFVRSINHCLEREHRFRLCKIAGDGNCQYLAVAKALGLKVGPSTMRKTICETYKGNDKTFTARHSRDGEWGDEDTLMQLSRVYDFFDCLHLDEEVSKIFKCNFVQIGKGKKVIHLRKTKDHYDALLRETLEAEEASLAKGGSTVKDSRHVNDLTTGLRSIENRDFPKTCKRKFMIDFKKICEQLLLACGDELYNAEIDKLPHMNCALRGYYSDCGPDGLNGIGEHANLVFLRMDIVERLNKKFHLNNVATKLVSGYDKNKLINFLKRKMSSNNSLSVFYDEKKPPIVFVISDKEGREASDTLINLLERICDGPTLFALALNNFSSDVGSELKRTLRGKTGRTMVNIINVIESFGDGPPSRDINHEAHETTVTRAESVEPIGLYDVRQRTGFGERKISSDRTISDAGEVASALATSPASLVSSEQATRGQSGVLKFLPVGEANTGGNPPAGTDDLSETERKSVGICSRPPSPAFVETDEASTGDLSPVLSVNSLPSARSITRSDATSGVATGERDGADDTRSLTDASASLITNSTSNTLADVRLLYENLVSARECLECKSREEYTTIRNAVTIPTGRDGTRAQHKLRDMMDVFEITGDTALDLCAAQVVSVLRCLGGALRCPITPIVAVI